MEFIAMKGTSAVLPLRFFWMRDVFREGKIAGHRIPHHPRQADAFFVRDAFKRCAVVSTNHQGDALHITARNRLARSEGSLAHTYA